MFTPLEWIGGLVVLGFLIKVISQAIQTSGLEEFTLMKFRFKGNEKTPKQLKE
jgi:hypothetical protein